MPIFDVTELLADPPNVIARLVTVDVYKLEDELARHPGLFAYAVALFEEAKSYEAAAKADLEFLTAGEFHGLIRDDPRLSMTKAERLVKEATVVRTQQLKYVERMKTTGIFRALTSALEHRRDMMVQIAARQRQELGSTRH